MTAEPSEEDLEIFEQALKAVPLHVIAKERKMSRQQIDDCLVRVIRPFDAAMMTIARGLAVERWNRLVKIYYEKALNGDMAATALLTKIDERRSALTGIDVPSMQRRDRCNCRCSSRRRNTTTEQIQRVIDKIRGNIGPAPKPKEIEGETEAKPAEIAKTE